VKRPISEYPKSSAKIIRIFGLASSFDNNKEGAAKNIPAA
jgi:hypothetical protein